MVSPKGSLAKTPDGSLAGIPFKIIQIIEEMFSGDIWWLT